MGRPPGDFLNISTDMNMEVDALDPSIMDFALQGEMQEMGVGWGWSQRWEPSSSLPAPHILNTY